MPFGAHESMEAHEILHEKMNMINHFNLYLSQCQDQTLKQMLQRHIQTATLGYNAMVQYTHDYTKTQPIQPPQKNVGQQQVQYGMQNPSSHAPQIGSTVMSDPQIAGAMLSLHKNSAKNHLHGALECADPNVRQMMVNGAMTCEQQAYEVFTYMNQQGWYQVPTLNDQTAKTLLHSYQPVPQHQMVNQQQMQQNQQQMNQQQMGQKNYGPQHMINQQNQMTGQQQQRYPQ